MIATSRTSSDAPPAGRRWSGLHRLLAALAAMWRNRQDRRQLAMLSDSMLADIGLTRADVERELTRPMWNGIDYAALDAARARAARRTGKARRPR